MRCNRNHNHNKFHDKANLTQHELNLLAPHGGARERRRGMLKLPSEPGRQSVSHKSLSYLPPYCCCYTYHGAGSATSPSL